MNNTAYTQLARKIPAQVRDNKILNVHDPIQHAIASSKDPHMMSLAKIWYTFVEPHAEKSYDCPKCMANILHNYREIKPTLVELKREDKLLESL